MTKKHTTILHRVNTNLMKNILKRLRRMPKILFANCSSKMPSKKRAFMLNFKFSLFLNFQIFQLSSFIFDISKLHLFFQTTPSSKPPPPFIGPLENLQTPPPSYCNPPKVCVSRLLTHLSALLCKCVKNMKGVLF